MFRRLILFIAIIVIVLVAAVFFIRARLTSASFGPMVALCPGPDYYGYVCERGTAFAYINATHDTLLYELDGTTKLELPFVFTFYGTPYTELVASSNGNLQFSSNNAEYLNDCLDEKPAAGMGDMIAPYWDDLDLRLIGFLETEVVGEAPDRIFVIEWDGVPRYETGEPLTFEVQLFEGSNDIVFLYQDVTQSEGGHGRKATIGIQSEAQGLALQYGCDLAVVADASQIRFAHPDNANGDVGLAAPPTAPVMVTMPGSRRPAAGGDPAADLLAQINLRGEVALADLHRQWISQSPPVTAVWERADLTGDSLPELVVLRHSTIEYPHLSQIIVLTPDPSGRFTLLLDQLLSTRKQPIYRAGIEHVGDLTHDDQADMLLYAADTGDLLVLTATFGAPKLLSIPDQCLAGLAVLDVNNDGRDDIVRDGCTRDGRVYTTWNGQSFTNTQ